ncbi:MAG: competence/damage-inducible protein A [Clostridia bacterium]|nr:competence/damage-inducible protein A [Clostridia bacterium]
MSKTVEILAVGTEILLGEIVNTDATAIAGELARLGFASYRQTVVGDNPERIRGAIREALSRSDVLITTGGLGPTCDDVTRNAAAEFFCAPLEEDPVVRADIESFFEGRGRKVTENNFRQALVPRGATVFRNSRGTAPGLALRGESGEAAGKVAILLPGPPTELEPMLYEQVSPYLAALSDGVIVSLNLHLYGIGESSAEDVLRPIMEAGVNPTVAPYACESEVRIRITARGSDEDECRRMCRETAEKVRSTEVGKYIFAETEGASPDDGIVTYVSRLLRERGLTVGTAESCTAGMIASRIADLPGSSDILTGGIVSYANEVKTGVLGVDPEVIEKYGAVSEQCARQMAEGARRALGCDIAVSVTGIAGPGGGTPEKPMGTVCFGVSDKNGTETKTLHLGRNSDRGKIRRRTVAAALMYVAERINAEGTF